MRLTEEQLREYNEKGFVFLPNALEKQEIEMMRDELARVATVDTDAVVKEKSGDVRSIFRVHDPASPIASPVFERLVGMPRLLEPARQILDEDELYVYHSKCNLKPAINGAVFQWHQDYGHWKHDGVAEPDLTTALIMLDSASQLGGCAYFIPGSHKLGCIEPVLDEHTTSYKLWTVPKNRMIEIMEEFGDPVPIVGQEGTMVLFHPNIVHCSGHNMSRHSRWHVFIVYNQVKNHPETVPNPRPEWAVSRDYRPVQKGTDSDLVQLQNMVG